MERVRKDWASAWRKEKIDIVQVSSRIFKNWPLGFRGWMQYWAVLFLA
jgi:hypothetical protein